MPDESGPFRLVGDDEAESQRKRRGIALLPNLITTAALLAGFFAIVSGIRGNFIAAAFAIVIAQILDAMDGRVARLTRTESEFGAQYDSLSDMVAFGVAPGILVFQWGLGPLHQAAHVLTFTYMACAALRLARFNTTGSSESFTGLPTPASAGIIASGVWLGSTTIPTPGVAVGILVALLTLLVSALMICNIKYFSPKKLSFKGRVPFLTLVGLVVGMAVLLAHPPLVLFIAWMAYALSAPAIWLYKNLPELRQHD